MRTCHYLLQCVVAHRLPFPRNARPGISWKPPRTNALPSLALPYHSRYTTEASSQSNGVDSMNVKHSQFLADASPGAKWKSSAHESGSATPDEFDGVSEGKGILTTLQLLFDLAINSQEPF